MATEPMQPTAAQTASIDTALGTSRSLQFIPSADLSALAASVHAAGASSMTAAGFTVDTAERKGPQFVDAVDAMYTVMFDAAHTRVRAFEDAEAGRGPPLDAEEHVTATKHLLAARAAASETAARCVHCASFLVYGAAASTLSARIKCRDATAAALAEQSLLQGTARCPDALSDVLPLTMQHRRGLVALKKSAGQHMWAPAASIAALWEYAPALLPVLVDPTGTTAASWLPWLPRASTVSLAALNSAPVAHLQSMLEGLAQQAANDDDGVVLCIQADCGEAPSSDVLRVLLSFVETESRCVAAERRRVAVHHDSTDSTKTTTTINTTTTTSTDVSRVITCGMDNASAGASVGTQRRLAVLLTVPCAPVEHTWLFGPEIAMVHAFPAEGDRPADLLQQPAVASAAPEVLASAAGADDSDDVLMGVAADVRCVTTAGRPYAFSRVASSVFPISSARLDAAMASLAAYDLLEASAVWDLMVKSRSEAECVDARRRLELSRAKRQATVAGTQVPLSALPPSLGPIVHMCDALYLLRCALARTAAASARARGATSTQHRATVGQERGVEYATFVSEFTEVYLPDSMRRAVGISHETVQEGLRRVPLHVSESDRRDVLDRLTADSRTLANGAAAEFAQAMSQRYGADTTAVVAFRLSNAAGATVEDSVSFAAVIDALQVRRRAPWDAPNLWTPCDADAPPCRDADTIAAAAAKLTEGVTFKQMVVGAVAATVEAPPEATEELITEFQGWVTRAAESRRRHQATEEEVRQLQVACIGATIARPDVLDAFNAARLVTTLDTALGHATLSLGRLDTKLCAALPAFQGVRARMETRLLRDVRSAQSQLDDVRCDPTLALSLAPTTEELIKRWRDLSKLTFDAPAPAGAVAVSVVPSLIGSGGPAAVGRAVVAHELDTLRRHCLPESWDTAALTDVK